MSWMCMCSDPDCQMNGCKYIRAFKKDPPSSTWTPHMAEELKKLSALKPLPKSKKGDST